MANHNVIKDSGDVFQIIPTTKRILVPAGHRIIGAVGDKNSEQLTFKCLKMIDGHNVAECSKKWVVWENARGDLDRDVITDITTDDEYVYLKWTISEKITPTQGYIGIAILFEDIVNGVTTYSWGTTTCRECYIVETLAHKSATRVEETIPKGYVKILENDLSVTANGTYTVAEEGKDGKDGYAYPKVNVNVPAANPTLEALTVTKNGTYYPKTGNDGFSYATVDVVPETEVLELDIKENKTYHATPSTGKYYSRVKVTPQLQEKTVTVKANGETITPDTDYCGLSEVTVNISTEAPRYQSKTAYYNNDTIYPDSGYDALSRVDIKIPTQSKTVTPTKDEQTVKPTGEQFLGEVVVYPIPSEYIKPSGNMAITSNTLEGESIDVTNWASVTVNVQSNAKPEQTKTVTPDFSKGSYAVIPDSGKVLTQVTILKPSNLISSNIREGVTIAGIIGTYKGSSSGDSSGGSSGGTTEHMHKYVNGVCDCGAVDPNYEEEDEHIHNYVNGKCFCGATDPNYTPPTTGTKMYVGRTSNKTISALSTLKNMQSSSVGSKTWNFTTTGSGYIYIVVPAGKSVSVKQSGNSVSLTSGGSFTDSGVAYSAYRTGTAQGAASYSWVVTVY